jgi:alpha-methylacyl-CoA racemase
MERLGLGPDVCLTRNPRLVYGRMTGFGQDGPLAHAAGHDINYIALSGVLAHIGRAGQPPTPPINLIGDFGGGGLLLAFGMVCALLERVRSGKGQVVDAAMVDGAAALMTIFHGAQQAGFWKDAVGTNMLDSGAPFYDAYETADGKYVAIGAIEPQFYAELLAKLGSTARTCPTRTIRPAGRCCASGSRRCSARARATRGASSSRAATRASRPCSRWPRRACTRTRTRARVHRRRRRRAAAPAPRFSRTDAERRAAPRAGGADTDEVLREWGFARAEIAQLRDREGDRVGGLGRRP